MSSRGTGPMEGSKQSFGGGGGSLLFRLSCCMADAIVGSIREAFAFIACLIKALGTADFCATVRDRHAGAVVDAGVGGGAGARDGAGAREGVGMFGRGFLAWLLPTLEAVDGDFFLSSTVGILNARLWSLSSLFAGVSNVGSVEGGGVVGQMTMIQKAESSGQILDFETRYLLSNRTPLAHNSYRCESRNYQSGKRQTSSTK